MEENFTGSGLLAFIFICVSGLCFGQKRIPQKKEIVDQISGKHIVEKAIKQITASSAITSGSTEYIAGDVIILKPGFYVRRGASFYGKIEPVHEVAETVATVRLPAEPETRFDETQFLSNVYPNPFVSETYVDYWLPKSTAVRVTVFNISGQEVARLVDKQSLPRGRHRVKFNPYNVPAGIYQLVISTPDARLVHKIIKK